MLTYTSIAGRLVGLLLYPFPDHTAAVAAIAPFMLSPDIFMVNYRERRRKESHYEERMEIEHVDIISRISLAVF
jgi:hypothetical protein